ncbi:hypothetical protein A6A05_09095 [Magnetospirillum moscoviense]|uniref:diguanylate cyclase n=2 Tax=Magnetospirillum moscoviense TaxID=1437059 RepID=A0A178MW15_9PROT|nr:hypothetical protein A6A05_09095 [Magnetospirillum moscoviense]
MDMEPGQNIIDLATERRRRGPRFDGEMMQILEVSRDLICLCRGGAITAINGAGARMLGGKTTEELIGRRMAEFLIPEYGPVLDLFLAGMASEDRPVPTRIQRLDGLTRDVELQVHRAREIAADATVVTCRDITKEGKLAGSAQDSDSRFHLLVDNSMNLVCHVVAGVIRYVNQAGLKMLGAAEPEAVLGRRLEEIFHPDYADLLKGEMIETAIAEDTSVPLRLHRQDGSNFDAIVKIAKLPSRTGQELMVEARDITAHNRAVMALRRANETLEMRVVSRTRELAEQRAKAEEMRQIADAARRFTERLTDTVPSPVWFRDARGNIQSANRAFRDLFGPGDGAAALPDEDAISDVELMAGTIERTSFEAAIMLPGGGRVDGLFLKTAFCDEEGRPVGTIGIMTDISDRKVMERELRRLATTDPLTGAHNRRNILSLTSNEMERCLRYGHEMSVLMLDVDVFKMINDRHGHATGDDALKALVATCKDSLRDIDAIGRMGGEEFAIMLPETGLSGALEVAERLRGNIEALRLKLADGGAIGITASIGLTTCRPEDVAVDILLNRADQALYRAKEAGRNRVEAG